MSGLFFVRMSKFAGAPADHPLDMTDARGEAIRDADVVLGLDVSSFLTVLGETDRTTREVRVLNERTQIIAISLDDYAFRSWAHTFQSLAPVDLPIAAQLSAGDAVRFHETSLAQAQDLFREREEDFARFRVGLSLNLS